MLKPLGDRVVLKIEEKEQTVGGFVIAKASQAETKTAEVIAVGEGVRTLSGELVAPSVKAGDHVLIEAHAGIDVKDGDEKYLIVGEASILAIVEE
ncbi:co-chaperone GroES [Streptococcus oralis]|uniref:co-chaperone GroES n=1 Tax=Streptococcus oralis TaxID=1303 RepID=UPI002283B7EE|nr:co-chaperone GroES [Streptococcus oralis]MCY7086758.1 co-chaperone GroES [Streptococcus oralis]